MKEGLPEVWNAELRHNLSSDMCQGESRTPLSPDAKGVWTPRSITLVEEMITNTPPQELLTSLGCTLDEVGGL